MAESKKFQISIEILNFLLQKKDYISTTEIQKHLVSTGLLKSDSAKSSDRRKLNRTLNFLESIGYIESKDTEAKGRTPQKWRINKKALPYLVSISDKELISLLTLSAFIPNNYKNLSIFSPFFDLVFRLSDRLSFQEREIISNSFINESQFLEKFLEFKEEVLNEIHNAIIDKVALRIRYKNSTEVFKIYPIKIFVYNGIIYVGAVKNKVYRTFLLAGINILEKLKEKTPEFFFKKYKNITFDIEREKPFLFGIKVAKKPSLEYFQAPQIFTTQFFFSREKDNYLIYLVGYTGSRFTSRFLVEEVIDIIPPTENIILKAKELDLKKRFPTLTFSLKENEKRFFLFKEELEEFIAQRLELLQKLNYSSLK